MCTRPSWGECKKNYKKGPQTNADKGIRNDGLSGGHPTNHPEEETSGNTRGKMIVHKEWGKLGEARPGTTYVKGDRYLR